MPTRKISGPDDGDTKWVLEQVAPCRHPEHDPPNMAVLSPGTYEHECPSCHRTQVFHVRQAFCACGPTTVRFQVDVSGVPVKDVTEYIQGIRDMLHSKSQDASHYRG